MQDEHSQLFRLLIMRHAKSSWSSKAETDHARPLNNRGRRDAPKIGQELVERGWAPELVISSDSQRTRETWEGMADTFDDGEVEVVFTRALYHAGLAQVEALLGSRDDQVRSLMLLGHNPGWHDMVAALCGEKGHKITTANVALLSHEAHDGGWPAVIRDRGGWTLHEVLRPKELKRKKG